MNKVSYDEISKIYDDVREGDIELINCLLAGANLGQGSSVLDIGCGTGNYTALVEIISGAQVYGLDASQGMLERAAKKNPRLHLAIGDAADLPYEDGFFDFIFMTDVIHHIADINAMFRSIARVLKPFAKVCIATQSHRQIDARYVSEFFPATASVDKRRYPDVPEIVVAAAEADLVHLRSEVIDEGHPVEIGDHFLELVAKKGYSMFHLITDEEYQTGLSSLKAALARGAIVRAGAGETLVWFRK
jgi:SAM-dependent methyltransferase